MSEERTTTRTAPRLVPDQPRHLEREWRNLVVRIEIEDASPHQLREMRRAFFAGALAYAALVGAGPQDGNDRTVAAVVSMKDAIGRELEAFAAAVLEGRD